MSDWLKNLLSSAIIVSLAGLLAGHLLESRLEHLKSELQTESKANQLVCESLMKLHNHVIDLRKVETRISHLLGNDPGPEFESSFLDLMTQLETAFYGFQDYVLRSKPLLSSEIIESAVDLESATTDFNEAIIKTMEGRGNYPEMSASVLDRTLKN
ncbi:hypothetical protein KKG66_05840, partial [bacterium]|nr:hypothetical protein [bacterium]